MAAAWQVQNEAPGPQVVLSEHGRDDEQDRHPHHDPGRRGQAGRVVLLQPVGGVQVHPEDEERRPGESLRQHPDEREPIQESPDQRGDQLRGRRQDPLPLLRPGALPGVQLQSVRALQDSELREETQLRGPTSLHPGLLAGPGPVPPGPQEDPGPGEEGQHPPAGPALHPGPRTSHDRHGSQGYSGEEEQTTQFIFQTKHFLFIFYRPQ